MLYSVMWVDDGLLTSPGSPPCRLCRQGMLIAILTHFGVIHETLTYSTEDVASGLQVR